MVEAQTSVAKVLKAAPHFEGKAYHNGIKNISLKDYQGKYVVLFWYPLDFTFVCPTEIIAFSDKAEEFEKLGCQVIGASTDSVFSHMEYCKKPRSEGGLGDMKIPLLADTTLKISTAYGCLIEEEGITFRATYIIDKKGVLRHMSINDTPVGRNVDEVLRLVEAFQFADENGEVCPANWKKGKKTLKADPTAKSNEAYWQEVHAKGGEK
mmetsp:Transcript_11330/g.12948  ORF Transcript_11330/g.12948 Transcript_11330/m.12948 type:complete len:209 (-) Transcript_11330:132-758(-)